MSYRGGPRGASRGFGSGGRGGARGGGGFSRGGRGGFQQTGPPDVVVEMGSFVHGVEGDIFCLSSNPKVPYFNAPIFLENKTPVGKVDEIMGPLNNVYFSVKPQEGIKAESFKAGDKFYIAADKLLPKEKFLPKPKVAGPRPTKVSKSNGRGGVRGGVWRGGRGTPRGRGGLPPRGRGMARGSGGYNPRGGRGGGRGSFGSRGRG